MNDKMFSYLRKSPATPCPVGKAEKDEFTLVRDGDNLRLEKTGTVDVQKQIQSYRDGVDLQMMIKRFQRGDDAALSRGSHGFYADVTGFEENPAQVIQNGREAMTTVSELVAKQKEKAAPQPNAADPQPNAADPQPNAADPQPDVNTEV